ncbi:342_t:CDS:2 [Funneliformis geosporum]|uniref:342_t:CDS:1 n=1 Tax=Funneliformis geosporum TaxID=1117311 RepID=A0A9W4X4X6_9GLOM|nr:342_t:CDS:2 [Funneliformis geosporum]
MAFYFCPYLYIDSCICGNKCYQQEGCHIYWKRRFHIPCDKCGTLTTSSYEIVPNPNRSDRPRE